MTTPIEQLAQLGERYPGVLGFVRSCPFGLVGEHNNSDDISIYPQDTYCVMSWNPSVPTTTLLPGLIRLETFVQYNEALGATPTTTTFHEELVWFYAFARAQALTGLDHHQLLAPAIARRWNQIAAELCAKSQLDEFQALRLSIIVGYGVPGSLLLRPIEQPIFRDAWLLAKTSKDFPSFLSAYRSIGGVDYNPAVSGAFARMDPPKKRIALHTCYGRTEGVLATTHASWVEGESGIRGILGWMLSHPLLYENHDLDRPVGLILNPHIHQRQDGHLEICADTLIIDESHWMSRDKYKGFSLGIQHE